MDDYEQEQREESYGRGHDDGETAGFLDELGHAIGDAIGTVIPETPEHESYDQGFQDGLRDRWEW